VVKLLSYYTSDEYIVGGFFSRVGNRHHIPEVTKILDDIKTIEIKSINDVIKWLDNINLQNKSDQLAGIIQFIKSNYSTDLDPVPMALN